MPALLAAIEQALAAILNVLGISQLMYGLLQQFGIVINTTAKEHFPFEVQGLGLAANNQLADPTFGLAAIKTELDGIGLAIIALGNPQQAANPVTLPTVPPAGYGGLSASATGDAVWLYTEPLKSVLTLETIQRLQAFMESWGSSASLVTRRSAYTRVVGTWDDIGGPTVLGDTPGVSPNDILSTDANLGDFLARAYPGFSWFFDSTAGEWFTRDTTSSYQVYVDWSEGEFLWYRQLATAGVPLAVVPPVWPGLANVTLGSPIPLAPPGQDVAIACDGALVDITGVPSWAGSFQFGTSTSWRNIGAISFLDDNGENEFPQTLGFAACVYVPHAMVHAAGISVRVALGVSGTITPFTIN